MATWTKEQTDDGRWGIAGPGPAYVAVSVFEEDADEIIADHEAREKLANLLERLCLESPDLSCACDQCKSLADEVAATLRDLRDADA